ncbi:fimbria/pilus outer membrane usher protein, partial [Burkholderia ubonensis]
MVGDASVDFDPSDLKLDLTVPQAAVKQNPQGYVSPELWDAGVPSATLAYNFTGSRSTGGESTDSQGFLGLNAGVNVGSWHFRHNGSMSWSTGRTREYQSIVTYLQHDVPSLRSQVKIGDTYTDGQFFDSFGVRGIQLATDDQMLPESMRGYAPVIRGVANSNARV